MLPLPAMTFDVQSLLAVTQCVLIPVLLGLARTLWNIDRRLYRVELHLGIEGRPSTRGEG